MRQPGKVRNRPLGASSLGIILVLFLATGAWAQTAGKVEGTVTDRDTNQPLPGTQVLVEGTQLGNISDDNGYYFVNNVPAGAQALTATFLGYQTESQQHRILAGQTTTVNFALSTEVIVADSAIVTVTERDPLVPRDNTISKARFVKENIQDLPIASLDNLASLSAGASEQQGGISLRGARPDDATVYVDGLNATDYSSVSSSGLANPQAGAERSPIEFGQYSVEQLDVVTGGADASFGDAQSGVLNIVTRRGGPTVSGNLRVTTDAMNIERTNGFNELQGNIGGPLLPDGKASFFLSGDMQGSRLTNDNFGFDLDFDDVIEVGERVGLDISKDRFCREDNCFDVRSDLPVRNIETFVQDYLNEKAPGFFEENEFLFNEGNENYSPGVFNDRYAIQGKLAFTPTANTDIQLSYTRNRDQSTVAPAAGNGFVFTGSLFNPFGNILQKETVDFAIGSVRQVFYQEADRSLAIEGRVGYFDDRYKSGVPFDLTAAGSPLLEANRAGDDFLNFRFSDYEFFFEDSLDEIIESYEGSNDYADVETLRQATNLGSAIQTPPSTQGGGADIFGIGIVTNGSGLSGFPLPTAGFNRGDLTANSGADGVINNREKRWNVRADFDAQLSRINRLQGGADLKFFDVRKFAIALGSRLFNSQYFVEPRLYGFYATNRIDLGDFVLDLGGRFDYFDHNTLLPEVPGIARVDRDGDGSTVEEYAIKTAFAPRLGVAHPVTENTQVRFSYGTFNQLPALDEMYLYMTSDINANDLNPNAILGNPDLDFQQTRSFELGITHLLSEDFVLDLVGYNRDIDKGTAARFILTPEAGQLSQLFNVNNGNVRGFDLTMTKRFSNYWGADVTYSYLDSKLTDSDQDQFTFNRGFNSTTDNPIAAPSTPLTADFDVTHKLATTFSLRFPGDFAENSVAGNVFGNFGVFATARLSSGLPFTRQPVNDGRFLAPPNSSRRDSDFQTDLRATKYFELGSGFELGAIFEVFNLFNNENLVSGNQAIPFGGTGINNGVYNTTGNRVLNGSEILLAEQQVTSDIVLADIDTSTSGGALTREFRGFSDIDGDGVVTSEEQRIMGRLAYAAGNEINGQPKRNYRMGLELRF